MIEWVWYKPTGILWKKASNFDALSADASIMISIFAFGNKITRLTELQIAVMDEITILDIR